MPDAIATDAGLHRHTWRTGLPQMPDRELSKYLIYMDKCDRKVSKVLKESEDLGLTYPQDPRSKNCPASVAIALVLPPFCRFIYQVLDEPTMRDKPVLEAT